MAAQTRSPSRASVASEARDVTLGAGFTSLDERYHFGAEPLASRHRTRTIHGWHGEQVHFQVFVPLPASTSAPLTLKVEVSDFYEPDSTSPAFTALGNVSLYVVKPVRADSAVVYDRLEALPLARRQWAGTGTADAVSVEVPLPADGLVPGSSDTWLLPVPWGAQGKQPSSQPRFTLLWGTVHIPTRCDVAPSYNYASACGEAPAATPAAGVAPTYTCTLRLSVVQTAAGISPPPGALGSGAASTSPTQPQVSPVFPGAAPGAPPRGMPPTAPDSPALQAMAALSPPPPTPSAVPEAVPESRAMVGPVALSLSSSALSSISTLPTQVDSAELSLHVTTPLPIPGPGQPEAAFGVMPPPTAWKHHLHLWQNPFAVAEFHKVPLWSPAHWAVLRTHYAPLAELGCTSITATILHDPWGSQTHTPYASMVRWLVREVGGSVTLSFDFSVFDAWVTMCLQLGIGPLIHAYSILPWAADGGGSEVKAAQPSQYVMFNETRQCMQRVWAHPLQPTYAALWVPFLEAFQSHLARRGWLGITAVAVDERPPEEMAAAIAMVRAHAPGLRLALAGNYHAELSEHVDDWCVWLRAPMPGPGVVPGRNCVASPTAPFAAMFQGSADARWGTQQVDAGTQHLASALRRRPRTDSTVADAGMAGDAWDPAADASARGLAARNVARTGAPSTAMPVALPPVSGGIPPALADRAAALAGRRTTTFYTCCGPVSPNTFTASPPLESTWLPLFGVANGYDGYLRWAYDCWTAEPNIDTRYRPRFWRAGDAFLAYPNGQPSVRMLMLQRGITAAEKQRQTVGSFLMTLHHLSGQGSSTQEVPALAQALEGSGGASPSGGGGTVPALPPQLQPGLSMQSSMGDVTLAVEATPSALAPAQGPAILPAPAPDVWWADTVKARVVPGLGSIGDTLAGVLERGASAGHARPGGFTAWDLTHQESFSAVHRVLHSGEAGVRLWIGALLTVLRRLHSADTAEWPLPRWPSDVLADDVDGAFARLLTSKPVSEWSAEEVAAVTAQASGHPDIASHAAWIAPAHVKPSLLFGPVRSELPAIDMGHAAEKEVATGLGPSAPPGTSQHLFLPRTSHPLVAQAVGRAEAWQQMADYVVLGLLALHGDEGNGLGGSA